MSYDIYAIPVAPGGSVADAFEARSEREETQDEPLPPTPEEAALRDRLAAALTGAGLDLEVAHTDEQGDLQLDNGTMQIELSGRDAVLNFPYWDSLDREQLDRHVFGALRILREHAGWRAYRPAARRRARGGRRRHAGGVRRRRRGRRAALPVAAAARTPLAFERVDDPCDSGVCGAEVPPLIGSVLTGTGLTLDEAVEAFERGEFPPLLSAVQRRLVEEHAARR